MNERKEGKEKQTKKKHKVKTQPEVDDCEETIDTKEPNVAEKVGKVSIAARNLRIRNKMI